MRLKIFAHQHYDLYQFKFNHAFRCRNTHEVSVSLHHTYFVRVSALRITLVELALFIKTTLILLLISCYFAQTARAQTFQTPEVFSYAELETLYQEKVVPPDLADKLKNLTTTPFIDNSRSGSQPVRLPQSVQIGRFLRVAHWNIERGLEYKAIEAAFSSEAECAAILDSDLKRYPVGGQARAKVLQQAALLRAADVIVLNEVDWGMKRTGYRQVAADLAAHLNMNYAFGVQFIELSPVYLSEKPPSNIKLGVDELTQVIKVDPLQYKGLHGIAILSRFTLKNVRLVPFKHQLYDWYQSEKDGASILEKGKREISSKVFLEETLRQVRRGGRSMLLADLEDARFPAGMVTIAATHLENRTSPAKQVLQLNELLELIKDIRHPVVITGDMNTSTVDLTPTSLRREFFKRFGSPKYLLSQGIIYALSLGTLQNTLLTGITFWRSHADPTVRHVPYVLPNPSKKFFSTLKSFRFADGGAFDFRGDPERSINRKQKTLSNSNERGQKGFITTYQVARPFYFVGKYKLDWVFVKPAHLLDPLDSRGSYLFAPHFGRTLTAINEMVKDCISDHRPLIVDLPLEEQR